MSASDLENPPVIPLELATATPTEMIPETVDEFEDPASPDDAKLFDRWGRYSLPHPLTGTVQGWTRASTLAKALSDPYKLQQWAERMVAKGMAIRPDLVELAATIDPDESRDARDDLQEISDKAKEAAGAGIGANRGTALHGYVEKLDAGVPMAQMAMSDATKRDLIAYRNKMRAEDITPIPSLTERVVCNLELNVCGKYDRVCQDGEDGPWRIADLKTQKVMMWNLLDISIQLAIYANADYMWNFKTRKWEPMPKLDLSKAIVMHLPVGKGECTIHDVDIEKGIKYARQAYNIREGARKDKTVVMERKPNHAKQYRKAIAAATTRAELSAVWKAAESRKEWTPELETLGKARLAELES